jgi:hypothetical protein
MRTIKPDATYLKGPKAVADDIGFVTDHGCSDPVSMIHNVNEARDDSWSVSAGIMVETGFMRR